MHGDPDIDPDTLWGIIKDDVPATLEALKKLRASL
jgi:uncharacterized protein with HEPN domain